MDKFTNQQLSTEQKTEPKKGGLYEKLKISKRAANLFVILTGLALVAVLVIAVITAG